MNKEIFSAKSLEESYSGGKGSVIITGIPIMEQDNSEFYQRFFH